MLTTIDDAQTYGRIWDLPIELSKLDDDPDRLAVPLGRDVPLRHGGNVQLCAWSAPNEIGEAAAALIEGGRSQAAVYRLPPNRVVILGRQTTWLSPDTRTAFRKVGVVFHDDGLAWLPQPGLPGWMTYSLDLTRLPGTSAVEMAIQAAVISRTRRNTHCTSLSGLLV